MTSAAIFASLVPIL